MRFLGLLGLLVMLNGVVVADAPESREFQHKTLKFAVVSVPSSLADTSGYQIIVSDDVATLSRLDVDRNGLVTDAWMTDLDGDGAVEIVVATGLLNESAVGAVDVHEWEEFRFKSTKTPSISRQAHPGYRGNDQFSVADKRLTRVFPIFTQTDGRDVPSGQIETLTYSFAKNQWVSTP